MSTHQSTKPHTHTPWQKSMIPRSRCLPLALGLLLVVGGPVSAESTLGQLFAERRALQVKLRLGELCDEVQRLEALQATQGEDRSLGQVITEMRALLAEHPEPAGIDCPPTLNILRFQDAGSAEAIYPNPPPAGFVPPSITDGEINCPSNCQCLFFMGQNGLDVIQQICEPAPPTPTCHSDLQAMLVLALKWMNHPPEVPLTPREQEAREVDALRMTQVHKRCGKAVQP